MSPRRLFVVILVAAAGVRAHAPTKPTASNACASVRKIALRTLDYALDVDGFTPEAVDGGLEAARLARLLDSAVVSGGALEFGRTDLLVCQIVAPLDCDHGCASAIAVERSDDLNSLARLIEAVAREHSVGIGRRRRRRRPHSPRVVVVGAGPGGLLSALESLRVGAAVTLLEARAANVAYRRSVWFDVMPDAAEGSDNNEEQEEVFAIDQAPGLRVLTSLGLFTQRESADWIVRHDGFDGITVRCSSLERFLAKVLAMLRVAVRFGSAFSGACSAESAEDGRRVAVATVVGNVGNHSSSTPWSSEVVVRSHLPPCRPDDHPQERPAAAGGGGGSTRSTQRRFPFDLLVGSDGARSAVRAWGGATLLPQSRFTRRGDEEKVYNDVPTLLLHQPSVLLHWRLDPATGGCPALKAEATPFSPAIELPRTNVTSLWKRFFGTHCEMQALFRAGTRVVENESESEVRRSSLLAALLPLVNSVLATPLMNVKALDAALLDVRPFRIAIGRASLNGGVLSGAVVGEGGGATAAWLLIGDASVTAHYRLGIGINTIFRGLASLGGFVAALVESESASESEWLDNLAWSFEEWRRSSERRTAWMVQVQLRSIYEEAYCGFATYKESVYRLDEARSEFVEMDGAEAALRCPGPQ